jgi:tricarballylate dehydrogenase
VRETTFVSVEPEALVLSTNGGPIPGPCAGQLTGRFQHEYPPETSALRAPTFGRVARRNLARERVGAMVSP